MSVKKKKCYQHRRTVRSYLDDMYDIITYSLLVSVWQTSPQTHLMTYHRYVGGTLDRYSAKFILIRNFKIKFFRRGSTPTNISYMFVHAYEIDNFIKFGVGITFLGQYTRSDRRTGFMMTQWNIIFFNNNIFTAMN